jgi:hypothetical protein
VASVRVRIEVRAVQQLDPMCAVPRMAGAALTMHQTYTIMWVKPSLPRTGAWLYLSSTLSDKVHAEGTNHAKRDRSAFPSSPHLVAVG